MKDKPPRGPSEEVIKKTKDGYRLEILGSHPVEALQHA